MDKMERRNGVGARHSALEIGSAASTVMRELRSNQPLLSDSQATIAYYPGTGAVAHRLDRYRCGRAAKLMEDGSLYKFVCDKLILEQWAIRRVATFCEQLPGNAERRVGHGIIYTHPRGSPNTAMAAALRQRTWCWP